MLQQVTSFGRTATNGENKAPTRELHSVSPAIPMTGTKKKKTGQGGKISATGGRSRKSEQKRCFVGYGRDRGEKREKPGGVG